MTRPANGPGPAPDPSPLPDTRYPCGRCGEAHALPPRAGAEPALAGAFAALDLAPPPGVHVVGVLVAETNNKTPLVWAALSGLGPQPDLGARPAPPLWDREQTRALELQALAQLAQVADALAELTPKAEAVRARLAPLSHARQRRALEAEREALESQRLALVRERRRVSAELTTTIHASIAVALPGGARTPLAPLFQRMRGAPMPTGTGECAAPRLLHAANLYGATVLAMAEAWWEPPAARSPRHGTLATPCMERCQPILGALLCQT